MNPFFLKKYGMMQAYRNASMSREDVCNRFVDIDRAFFRRFIKVYIFKLNMSSDDAIQTVNHIYWSSLYLVLDKLKPGFSTQQCLEYAFKSCKNGVTYDILQRTRILRSDKLVEIETVFVPTIDDCIIKKRIQKYICDKYDNVKEGTTKYIVLKNIINCIFNGEFIPTAELAEQTTVSKQAINKLHNEIVQELTKLIQGA